MTAVPQCTSASVSPYYACKLWWSYRLHYCGIRKPLSHFWSSCQCLSLAKKWNNSCESVSQITVTLHTIETSQTGYLMQQHQEAFFHTELSEERIVHHSDKLSSALIKICVYTCIFFVWGGCFYLFVHRVGLCFYPAFKFEVNLINVTVFCRISRGAFKVEIEIIGVKPD